jgi:hypothetical protein
MTTKLGTPRDVIKALEDAIELHRSTKSPLERDTAKLMVIAGRHALQAQSLEFAERRFPIGTSKIIETEAKAGRSSVSKIKTNANTSGRKDRRLGR